MAFAQQQLNDVVVTATRLETPVQNINSDITVIDAAQIEQQSGRSLTEIIAQAAGLQLVANGGLGKASNILIRGTEGRHVLLLVDGVRVGSATLGTASFDNLAIHSIERIEVLKGPASALYGSDAVGGVVQIFTRKGSKDFQPEVSITAGSFGHRQTNASISGSSGNIRYALGGAYLKETGFSASNEKAPFFNFNADKDGFEQTSAFASVSADVAQGWTIDAKLQAANGTSSYDSGEFFDPTTDMVNQVINLGVRGKISQNWITNLRFGQSDDKSTTFESYGTDTYNTRQQQLTWSNEIQTPVGTVLAGLEQTKEKVSGTTAYDLDSRTINAVFLGLVGNSNAHSWQANLRHDKNSQFGGATTGMIGYGYKINPNLKVNTAYGTSFKAPSFNQLYYPQYGNSTIQPEEGRNFEIGATYVMGAHELKVTRFDQRIQGFITTLPVVENVPKVRIDGWTLAYQTELGGLNLRTSLDLLNPRNVSNDLVLNRRAKTQLSLDASYTTGAWTIGSNLQSLSKRFDDSANTVELAAYTTADVYANYQVNKDWSVKAKVNNLMDKAYETALGYNQAGRSFYLTLNYSPK
jgi:vitamin B12 transporter